MLQGWIKLHRKIRDHWIWKDPFYLKLWLDFLMRANHEGTKIPMGSNFIDIERGSFLTSQLKLASEYGCSRKRINTFLNLLANGKMIGFKGNSKYTIITISNYNTYQDSGTTEEQQKNIKRTAREHQKNSSSTSKEHQKHTEKNVKNYKNVKNEKNEKNFKERTKEEPSDEISLLWIKTFGKNPNLIEREESQKLIKEFGKHKVEKEFREAIINGAKSLRYVINKLSGNVRDFKQSQSNKNYKQSEKNNKSNFTKDGYVGREFGKDFGSAIVAD